MTTALLVIDIQNDYFPNGKMELTGPDAAAINAARLLSDFREKGAPIFHVKHITKDNAAHFFHPDTKGVEIHESVRPLDEEPVIIKHMPNSFFNTNLHEELQKEGVTELVVCGMMTHMCIDSTVRAAVELGYSCQVIEDACATTSLEIEDKVIPAEQIHYAFMAALNSAFATVRKTAEFLK